jgi:hypothetical protein
MELFGPVYSVSCLCTLFSGQLANRLERWSPSRNQVVVCCYSALGIGMKKFNTRRHHWHVGVCDPGPDDSNSHRLTRKLYCIEVQK